MTIPPLSSSEDESARSQPSDRRADALSVGLDAERAAAFTPGPWTAERGGELMPGSERLIIATRGFDNGIRRISTLARTFCNPGHAEAEANARLIAAAPDLLAALIRFRTEGDGYGRTIAEYVAMDAQCDAAIAKALGASTASPESLGVSQDEPKSSDPSTAWREIASAPRDGTWFLAHGDGRGWEDCTFVCEWAEDLGGYTGWQEVPGDKPAKPLHWMPLPGAPS